MITILQVLLVITVITADAQSEEKIPPLRVDVFPMQIMAMEDGGKLTGLDVELVNAIAKELNRDVVFRNRKKAFDFLSGLHAGEADLAIGGISITDEREKQVDFSHHYFDSGLAILVRGTIDEVSIPVNRASCGLAETASPSAVVGLNRSDQA